MYRKSMSRGKSSHLAWITAQRTRVANLYQTFSRGGIRF